MWTKFFDLNSCGNQKLNSEIIWIEAKEKDAVEIFKKMFGRNPFNVTCECCGEDYSVYETEPNFEDGAWIVSRSDIDEFIKNNG